MQIYPEKKYVLYIHTDRLPNIPFWGVVLAGVVIICVAFAAQHHANVARARQGHHIACAAFQTQAQAQAAYNAGEKYLDRNGDGIACNSLLKK